MSKATIKKTRSKSVKVLSRKQLVKDASLLKDELACHVTVKGMYPGLLMNSPASMLAASKGKTKKRGEIPSPEEDAEIRAYRMRDKTLFIPNTAFKGTLINASAAYKIGRSSAKQLVAGTVRIFPAEISLGTKKYEIDMRPVVVQRSRIVRARPKLTEWSASLFVIWDSSFGIKRDDLKKMLTDAGKRVGILDFRPQHCGEFGRFTVESFSKEI